MNLWPFPPSSPVDGALRHVRLPKGAVLRCLIPDGAMVEMPDDAPDGWLYPGTWEWWSSLLRHLQSGDFGELRMVVERRMVLGFWRLRPLELEPDLALLREWLEREMVVPSGNGLFTLAWGVTGEPGRLVARGAAFSGADHVGGCLCALPDELEALRTWWDDEADSNNSGLG